MWQDQPSTVRNLPEPCDCVGAAAKYCPAMRVAVAQSTGVFVTVTVTGVGRPAASVTSAQVVVAGFTGTCSLAVGVLAGADDVGAVSGDAVLVLTDGRPVLASGTAVGCVLLEQPARTMAAAAAIAAARRRRCSADGGVAVGIMAVWGAFRARGGAGPGWCRGEQ